MQSRDSGRTDGKGGKAMKDKHGIEIKVGDILRYQETTDDSEDYGKSIDEVVMHNGEMCGVQRVGFPRWTVLENMQPFALRHYACFPVEVLESAEIIGNTLETPERMTPEYAHRIFVERA